MKNINRLIASFLVITFSFSNIAFAFDQNSFKLAPPSSFSNMKGEEFRESAQIMLGVREALKSIATFDADSLRSLGHVVFAQKTVFTKNKVAGTILFKELEECTVGESGMTIERGDFLVKTLIMDKVYYCLISRSDSAQGFDISVVPERLIREALEAGVVKFTHSSVNKSDKAVIDNYLEHEVSEDGAPAVDEWIQTRMLSGQYSVRAGPNGMKFLYSNAHSNIDAGSASYTLIKHNISELLPELGVSQDNRDSIMKAVADRSLVFIPYDTQENLPTITIAGKKVRVTAHTSQYAIYIFMPKAFYKELADNRTWSEKTCQYIENKLIHEIGAMCGLRPMVLEGEVRNLLDSIVMARRNWDGPFHPTDELKDLKPVDLFDLSLRRDYAAGRIEKVKTAFMRAMSLLIVTVMAILPAASAQSKDQAVSSSKSATSPDEFNKEAPSVSVNNAPQSSSSAKPAAKFTDEEIKSLRSKVIAAWKECDGTNWRKVIDMMETMLRDNPAWVEMAHAQAADLEKELKVEGKSPYDKASAVMGWWKKAPQNKVLANWALNDIGTAYFLLMKSYYKLGQNDKALEYARTILRDYNLTLCYDPMGWFWSTVFSMYNEFYTLYKKANAPQPSGSSEEEGEVQTGNQTSSADKNISEVLWMYGNGFMPKAEARTKLAALLPASGISTADRDMTIDALLAQAAGIFFGMTMPRSSSYQAPSTGDIQDIAATIKELDIEVYLPSTHIIKNANGQFRRTMETIFGDRLTIYQDVADLPRLIKNPARTIVMTVDLKEDDVVSLEKMKSAINGARFMNFESMKDMDRMTDTEYHNYIAEILGILMVARIITPEEARDKSSRSYRMLAHLLEEYLPNVAEMDNYIMTLVDGSIDPIAKLRYIIKTILKAMPISVYRAMQPAVEILWSA